VTAGVGERTGQRERPHQPHDHRQPLPRVVPDVVEGGTPQPSGVVRREPAFGLLGRGPRVADDRGGGSPRVEEVVGERLHAVGPCPLEGLGDVSVHPHPA
jgi:hypothetical protein